MTKKPLRDCGNVSWVNIDLAANIFVSCLQNFSKLFAMGPKESDHDSIPAEEKVVEKEMERDKSLFTVKLVILINAFLFSTCFFMDNSVFPVSIIDKSLPCHIEPFTGN